MMPSRKGGVGLYLNRNNLRMILLLVLGFIILSSQVLAQTAQFTNQQQLYFTGSSTDPNKLYQDGIGSNADVGIEVCGIPSTYVGGFYAINTGSWQYVLVTYSESDKALAQTSINAGGGCFQTPPGFMFVSPSELTTPDPDVKKAAFPGKLYIGYAASQNPGSISSFIFADSGAQLLGGSTGGYAVDRSFDQGTREIQVSTPRIYFQSPSSTFSFTADDSQFGVSSDKQLVSGICDDDEGLSCSDGGIVSSDIWPVDYSSGLASGDVNDQQTHTKYVVFNGIGKDICIGANLRGSVTLIDPNPIYYSQDLTVTTTYSNPRDTPDENQGGNVDVTTDFDVRITIYPQGNPGSPVYQNTFTITDTLAPSGTTQRQFTWPAFAKSGTYTVYVETDLNDDIAECNEGDNVASQNFELKPITLPDIFIDDVETSEFEYPNIPYNMKFHFKNSDNDTLSDADVRIIETNGLNIMAPTQIYNRTDAGNSTQQDGLVVQNRLNFITDVSGNSSFAFIPTYNRLYTAEYSYLNLENYIGGYELYMEGEQSDSEPFVFIIGGELSSQWNFTIQNVSFTGEPADKTILNENMVGQVFDFVYHTFTNFLETVLGNL